MVGKAAAENTIRSGHFDEIEEASLNAPLRNTLPVETSNATSAEQTRTYNSPRLIKRRADILSAARASLAENSYHGITMNDLALRAGVTKKTLYNVFGSKEELLSAAVRDVINQYRGADHDHEPGIPTLIASRVRAIDQVLADPDYANAMTSALLQADSSHELVTILITESIEFTREQIAVDVAAGLIDPELAIDTIAKQLVNQAWGINFMLEKKQFELNEYSSQSMTGLLLLLKGVTLGRRHEQISQQLREITS